MSRAWEARSPVALTGACWQLGETGVWRMRWCRLVAAAGGRQRRGFSTYAGAGERETVFWLIRRPGRVRARRTGARSTHMQPVTCCYGPAGCRTRPWSGQPCQLEVNAVPGLA
jgi:hypothetical protein